MSEPDRDEEQAAASDAEISAILDEWSCEDPDCRNWPSGPGCHEWPLERCACGDWWWRGESHGCEVARYYEALS